MIRIADEDLVLVDERDLDAHTAAFACVRCADGAVLWRNLRFEEPWWINLADMFNGVAYFHGYRRPNMPAPLGVHAVDLASGRILWNKPDYIFQFAVDSDVFVSQTGFSGAHHFILDAANGDLVKDLGTDDERVNALRAELNAIDQFRDYRYPRNFDETHPDYAELLPRVNELVDQSQVVGSLDVLAAGDHICAAWHEHSMQANTDEAALDQYIIIADRHSGELQFADQLHTNIPFPSADSFFLRKSQLFHIKDRNILKAHTLAFDATP
jgi:hypothetical protein